MALPLKYHVRSVFVRWRSTLATILGVALVVAVYVLVQALAVGLEKSSQSTGDPGNVLITRKGSTAESSSQVTLEQTKILQFYPEIARDAQGQPLLSSDVLTLINLPRRNLAGEANVLVRGVSPIGRTLRAQVRLAEGRWFSPGHREVVVARRLAGRFAGFDLGQSFKTGGRELRVVGWFEAGGTAFDSEVWMDADEARSVFDRENYSSLLVRTVDRPGVVASLSARLDGNKRLPLKAEAETDYYKGQTRTATPIRFLGNFLATAMSIGAVFAAMNTLYASVGARTREIGTLRVLGFRRRSILIGFLLEGAILASVGGVLGVILSLPMNGYATGTMSFENFSEVVFQFRITPLLATKGLVFAVGVGVVGSLLPALRASRVPVISALKSL